MEVISLHGDQSDKEYKYYTRGFHPWWTLDKLDANALSLLTQSYVENAYCLGIGECGLDNLKGAAIELQEEIFIQQILVANSIQAPMIIHCVRAFDRVLRLRKKYGQTPWAVHGFVRNKILAFQALDAGVYLSMAPHDQMKPSFRETLTSCPLDRIFIETDSETSLNITDRYRIFASLRSLSLEDVEEQIFENYKKFFSNKWKLLNG